MLSLDERLARGRASNDDSPKLLTINMAPSSIKGLLHRVEKRLCVVLPTTIAPISRPNSKLRVVDQPAFRGLTGMGHRRILRPTSGLRI